MPSYRVTFDASHKVKRGGSHISNHLHHVARGLDDANGVERTHSNRNIDRDRTHRNVTVIPDGAGGWKDASSVEQLSKRLDDRLATLKRPPRTNAVVLRPIVANLSPEWFQENNPNWRETGFTSQTWEAYMALVDQAVEEYGAENIIAASLHMDENLPQWQITVTPVTEDGRLSQKDWYSGPEAMRQMGVRYREAVAATGIEVNFKPAERSKEHFSGDEFGRQADMLRADRAEFDVARANLVEQAERINEQVEERMTWLQKTSADWAEPDSEGLGEGPKRRAAREKAEKKGSLDAEAKAANLIESARAEAERIADATRVALERARKLEEQAEERARELDEAADGLETALTDLDRARQEAGPIPKAPTNEEALDALRSGAPDVARRFINADAGRKANYETFALREFTAYQAKNRNALGETVGLSREAWEGKVSKPRAVAMATRERVMAIRKAQKERDARSRESGLSL